jgi:N-acetylmuramoyl-L-alanine amidase
MKKLILALALAPTLAFANVQKLAEAIYFEAADQPRECQVMVANVIMNRVYDKRWPDSVKEVIDQPLQFSYMNEVPYLKEYGIPEDIAVTRNYLSIYSIAQSSVNFSQPDLTDGANHYLNHKISNAKWWIDMQFVTRCGDHWFYRN